MSREVLALQCNAGEAPRGAAYLLTPPARDVLADIVRCMGVLVRAILRRKGTPYDELGLGDERLTDAQRLDAMAAHPVLIERPIVVAPHTVRLCRPARSVLGLLAAAAGGPGRDSAAPFSPAAGG